MTVNTSLGLCKERKWRKRTGENGRFSEFFHDGNSRWQEGVGVRASKWRKLPNPSRNFEPARRDLASCAPRRVRRLTTLRKFRVTPSRAVRRQASFAQSSTQGEPSFIHVIFTLGRVTNTSISSIRIAIEFFLGRRRRERRQERSGKFPATSTHFDLFSRRWSALTSRRFRDLFEPISRYGGLIHGKCSREGARISEVGRGVARFYGNNSFESDARPLRRDQTTGSQREIFPNEFSRASTSV